MVTGDEQISTVHIYAVPDPIRVKDPVKMKYYRSVTVCLVVLCVFLLTAVIVLCVKFTQERDQLTFKIDNLTKVTDYLQIKSQNVANERNQLIFKIDNLTKVTDYLQIKSQNLTNERDRLMWEKSELQKNLNTADGWIYYKSSLYFISSEKKSWIESRKYCRDKGADLIIINNRHEQDFVNKTCKEIIWIGLTDIEGTWKWVDGSTLDTGFWKLGEPNSYGGDEDCVETESKGWNDLACSNVLQSICEKNIFK